MNKLIIVALILVSAFAFTMDNQPIVSEEVHRQLKAISWPFTTCGDGKWDIQKLTLSSTPARNTNDSIDVVIIWFNFRPARPETALHSRTSFWQWSWTEPHCTQSRLLSLIHSTTETPLNSSSTTTSHHSLPQEPTDSPSNSLIPQARTTAAWHSSSNYDRDFNSIWKVFCFCRFNIKNFIVW